MSGWGPPEVTKPGEGKKSFTLITPYYENPNMLAEQCRHLASLSAEVREQLSWIVVDDGSSQFPAQMPNIPPLKSVSLYKALVDIRWNWLFCRNLAVSKSLDRWVLMTDIDHLLPEETARTLIYHEHNSRDAYRFSRVSAPDMLEFKPHPNSWFITTRMFDKVGGYDERFSGYYGSDGDFRDRVRATVERLVLLAYPLIRVPREVVQDASTTRYLRKQLMDAEGMTRIRAEREADEDKRPKRLLVPWVQVF